jgi:hypothetical protein
MHLARLIRRPESPSNLSPTQVRSIEILLKKSLPDLTATEITSVETRGLDDLSTEEILAMLQDHRMGGSKGDGFGLEEERGLLGWPMQPHPKSC